MSLSSWFGSLALVAARDVLVSVLIGFVVLSRCLVCGCGGIMLKMRGEE